MAFPHPLRRRTDRTSYALTLFVADHLDPIILEHDDAAEGRRILLEGAKAEGLVPVRLTCARAVVVETVLFDHMPEEVFPVDGSG